MRYIKDFINFIFKENTERLEYELAMLKAERDYWQEIFNQNGSYNYYFVEKQAERVAKIAALEKKLKGLEEQ